MYTVSTTPPLTRERAIAAAIATADAEGLDAVSMRRLATRLGVTAMALYKHVANKEDLLAGMVDAVVVDYESPVDPRDWRDAVAQRVRAARRALVRHPWMRRAIESRTARTAAVLGHMDAVAGEMLAGGLTPDLVHHAMHALGHRLWGFSPEAFDDDARPPIELTESERERRIAEVAAAGEALPAIVAITTDSLRRARTGSCDEDAEFEFALTLLLDGVERLRAESWSSS